MADNVDEAKAAFRATWEAAGKVGFLLKKADEKCSGRVRLLMTRSGRLRRREVCSPHEPRDAPKARPPAICGDARWSRISRRARDGVVEGRLLEGRAAHAGYASVRNSTEVIEFN